MSSLLSELPRILDINLEGNNAFFLWGALQDAPILAASLKGGADYLITLDAKDFLVEKVVSHVPFQIMKPSNFLKEYRTLLFHG